MSRVRRLMDAATYHDFILKIIRHADEEPGFKVLPRRLGPRRIFVWMPAGNGSFAITSNG
ncbi:hypothetical protein [Novosphingobium sp. fls2-241-R2A-195]|uniref:hypothetical protein n=1 Tax=Novosphingobium sp. fls2-241-R2A-195 TaxID=3040296 RepID=UPI0025504A78|nr:hypothetical protein [Novosphingobium sp. fls2-241-R2A-195]